MSSSILLDHCHCGDLPFIPLVEFSLQVAVDSLFQRHLDLMLLVCLRMHYIIGAKISNRVVHSVTLYMDPGQWNACLHECILQVVNPSNRVKYSYQL